MTTSLPRRAFLGSTVGSALAVAPVLAVAPRTTAAVFAGDDPAVHDAFPTTDPALVREVVGAAHVKIDRVRELVEAHPALARASWDWGFGDWESALGAASHMGRHDIAELLIAHGARPNLFTAAMMGQLEVVRATIEASPGVQRIPGPHGITLLAHARHGRATAVVEYLQSIGDADVRPASDELTEADQAPYLGDYVYGKGPTAVIHVERTRGGVLGLRREGAIIRRLTFVGDHSFYPSGAPIVRIHFDVADGRARTLTVHDHEPVLTAIRRAT